MTGGKPSSPSCSAEKVSPGKISARFTAADAVYDLIIFYDKLLHQFLYTQTTNLPKTIHLTFAITFYCQTLFSFFKGHEKSHHGFTYVCGYSIIGFKHCSPIQKRKKLDDIDSWAKYWRLLNLACFRFCPRRFADEWISGSSVSPSTALINNDNTTTQISFINGTKPAFQHAFFWKVFFFYIWTQEKFTFLQGPLTYGYRISRLHEVC